MAHSVFEVTDSTAGVELQGKPQYSSEICSQFIPTSQHCVLKPWEVKPRLVPRLHITALCFETLGGEA